MNRETELHFTDLPKINIGRSKFNMSHSHKTTFNTGQIIPIKVQEIIPGDTVELDIAEVVRMATPIFPVMDNLFLEITTFFCPNRLVMDHWKNFWGENDDPWTNGMNYEVPYLTAPSGGWAKGSLADYMGIPTKVNNIKVNALPFRAYSKIVGDWWRDENLMYTPHVYTDDTNRTGTNGTNYVTDLELGGMPAHACKMHDYFTSCLPSPQKGPAVSIPLGTTAPVNTGNPRPNESWHEGLTGAYWEYNSSQEKWINHTLTNQNTAYTWPTTHTHYANAKNDITKVQSSMNGTNTIGGSSVNVYVDNSNTGDMYWQPNNLWADLSAATAATINNLRTAFAIQKFYENAGRNGTRYIEFIRSVFGVESSDARLQRTEYTGGCRVPINIDSVLQTSSTDATTPQGNTAAFSCTIASDSLCTKSFEEHGYFFVLACVRTEHSYQQGIPRTFLRRKWTDYYNPFFATLGEMPVTNAEIYAQGTSTDDEAFGYQEAWADYRYNQNTVSGAMRSNVTGSLDVWHYADDYESLPTLGSTWIQEPKDNVDRTIAVQSEIENQFIADFYFNMAMVRPMPIYSIPGLIDHV